MAPPFVLPDSTIDLPQVVKDFARFYEDFRRHAHWGEIRVVFRNGVPMNIASTVDTQIRGPEQAAVASGRKPNGPEYRQR
jgi:hypothetical protein